MKTMALALALVALALAIPAGAEAGGPYCFDVYGETHVGPVTIVHRSSCDHEVCLAGDCSPLS